MSRPPPASRSPLRALPSVDRLLRDLGETGLPRPVVLAVVRRELAAIRATASAGQPARRSPPADALCNIRDALDALRRSRIQPVINATGIIIHTNLGRSPLGPAVAGALAAAATNYTNLEYALATGERGSRGTYVEHALATLCDAESATVVNNCAAALVLILRHFASRRPRRHVVISRGELVQIGGGFRIPDILEASGARLREIGTTNKTTLDDYRRAIDSTTAMVLKVHRSNFYMGGFVESPPTDKIAAVTRELGVPFVEDLGSGATFDTAPLGGRGGGEHEPTPAEVLAAGADLVCFSGDKLLGGPQAGLIAGAARHVAALKTEPFFRALRCDKLILAALETTVDLLLSDQTPDVPIRSMMQVPEDDLRQRAARIVTVLAGLPVTASVGTGEGRIGGGSLPKTTLESVTVDLLPRNDALLPRLAEALRLGHPPVVGYVSDQRLKLDLRTVFPRQDDQLVAAVRSAVQALGGTPGG
jgi:L-seryl-tRNA(Ser) seleniumtransferase